MLEGKTLDNAADSIPKKDKKEERNEDTENVGEMRSRKD